MKVVNFQLDIELYNQIKTIATEEDRTFPSVLRRILKNHVLELQNK